MSLGNKADGSESSLVNEKEESIEPEDDSCASKSGLCSNMRYTLPAMHEVLDLDLNTSLELHKLETLGTSPATKALLPAETEFNDRSDVYNNSLRNCESSASSRESIPAAVANATSPIPIPEESHISNSSREASPHGTPKSQRKSGSLESVMERLEDEGGLVDNADAKSDRVSDKHDSSGSIGKSKSSDKKKKTSTWYNMLNPTYKSRSDDFKKLFKELPESERLVVDYSCALQKDILVHGRLYVSQNFVGFYANIFRWETTLVIKFKDITSMTKEKTARVIPNAISINTDTDKHFFTSFAARDKTFMMLFRVWQNALLDQPMSAQELWSWVHQSYGEELGLTSDDDDYIAPSIDEKCKNLNSDAKHASDQSLHDGIDRKLDLETAIPSIEKIDKLLDHLQVYSDSSDLTVDNIIKDPSRISESSLYVESDTQQSPNYTVPLIENDLPTDQEDSTESDELLQEVDCSCEKHEGKPVMNSMYNITVDNLFTLLFTDCLFYREMLASRKVADLALSSWKIQADCNNKFRQITYTITLSNGVGPKTSATTETQTLYNGGKPGRYYIIDCEVQNGGIPYSDHFCVVNRYCLTRVSKLQSRLQVTSEIRYKKSVWGIVKNFIEKNAVQGITSYYKELDERLIKEAEKSSGQSLHKKSRRRRRHHIIKDPSKIKSDVSPEMQTVLISSTPKNKSTPIRRDSCVLVLGSEKGVRAIFVILIILLFINTLLFYKLWSLEIQTSNMAVPLSIIDDGQMTSDGKFPQSDKDWMKLLKQQKLLHHSEIDKWKDILGASIQLLEQMEKSLLELQKSITSSTLKMSGKMYQANEEL